MEYIAPKYKPLNDMSLTNMSLTNMSLTNMSLKEIIVAIYVRLSKEDLDRGECESESIQNQKAMLLNYAISRGWQVYNIYCDDYVIIGISERNPIKSRVSGTYPFFFFCKDKAYFIKSQKST